MEPKPRGIPEYMTTPVSRRTVFGAVTLLSFAAACRQPQPEGQATLTPSVEATEEESAAVLYEKIFTVAKDRLYSDTNAYSNQSEDEDGMVADFRGMAYETEHYFVFAAITTNEDTRPQADYKNEQVLLLNVNKQTRKVNSLNIIKTNGQTRTTQSDQFQTVLSEDEYQRWVNGDSEEIYQHILERELNAAGRATEVVRRDELSHILYTFQNGQKNSDYFHGMIDRMTRPSPTTRP